MQSPKPFTKSGHLTVRWTPRRLAWLRCFIVPAEVRSHDARHEDNRDDVSRRQLAKRTHFERFRTHHAIKIRVSVYVEPKRYATVRLFHPAFGILACSICGSHFYRSSSVLSVNRPERNRANFTIVCNQRVRTIGRKLALIADATSVISDLVRESGIWLAAWTDYLEPFVSLHG